MADGEKIRRYVSVECIANENYSHSIASTGVYILGGMLTLYVNATVILAESLNSLPSRIEQTL